MNPEVVTFDETSIACRRANGLVEHVLWDDLQAMIVQTTADGPFGEDVFWVLAGKQSGCVVPAGAAGAGELLERLQKLPGFDNLAFIEAMSCVEENSFVCWKRNNQD